jgi:hypothetical protein
MLTRQSAPLRCRAAALLAATLLMVFPGCDAFMYYSGMSEDMSQDTSGNGSMNGLGAERTVASAPMQMIGQPAPGQQLFATDQEAVTALLDAVKIDDHDVLGRILGPAADELISSGDPVEDRRASASFTEHAAQSTRLEKKDAQTTIMHVGEKDWPMPIPIVQTA